MKETKKRRYIVSTIMYGMILIFIQLPWVVLKGKKAKVYFMQGIFVYRN